MKREREGTVYYRKPGRMRWEFEGQDQELIVSDGKQIYSYQPDLNQVIETPLDQAFRSSKFAAFLLGIGNVERDFDASVPAKPPADDLTHVSLKPKNGGDVIEMGLDPANLDLEHVRLTDASATLPPLTLSDFKATPRSTTSCSLSSLPSVLDIVKAPQRRTPIERASPSETQLPRVETASTHI